MKKEEHSALELSKAELEDIYELSPVMLATVEASTGKIKRCNETMAAALGFARDELIGRRVFELYHPDSHEAAKKVFDLFLATGKARNAELQMRRRDGSRMDVLLDVSAVRDAGGHVIESRSVIRNITERKRAERTLRESERRLTSILNNTGTVVFLWANSEGWPVERVSDGVEALFGYTAEEFLSGRVPYVQVVHPDDLERVGEEVARYSREEGGRNFIHEPYRIVAKDGSVRWVDDRTHIRRDGAGRITHYEGIVQDITERKRAEQALRESEEKFRTIGVSAQDAIVMMDARGRISFWSDSAERIFGYKREEVLGKDCHTLLAAKKHRAASEKGVAAFIKTGTGPAVGKTLELAAARKDGTEFPVEISISAVKLKGEWNAIGIIRDITERRRTEAALEASRAGFRSIVEKNKDGIVVVGRGGDVRFLNGAAKSLLNGKGGVGRRFGLPLDPGKISEAELVRSSGERMVVELRVEDTEWAGEGAFLVTMRDVTARKGEEVDREKMRTQLQQSEKLAALGRLAGGVAHDFNNLLTSIRGYAELLMESIKGGGQEHEDLEEIDKLTERAAGLTRQLLAFSRRNKMQLRVLDMNRTIEGTAKMLKRLIREEVELRMDLAQDLGSVKGDPGQIEQVVMNLVINASDAIPEAGVITVSTRNVELKDGEPRPPGLRPGRYAVLTVADTGAGMDEDVLSSVFEPFFTTKSTAKGTGLGLSVVFGAVKQHGGHVEVRSAPGEGATFTAYFPAAEGAPESDAPASSPARLRGGTERLLLVEDEDPVRRFASRSLRRRGYTVLEAGDAREAEAVLKREDGRVDLLITDVVMPGMRGPELAERCRSRYPRVKVLFITGYPGDPSLGIEHLEREAPVLPKPFSGRVLASKVREVLEGT